ncbi:MULTISPECIES: FadR/GntR family transcriptional regulator [Sphingomonas]|uniref:FadR/GntR family transcriptional regulator n=1 Tax=Sphingomonas TaxID=13687 RepID=UPI000DEFCA08|nr:MULTISPECIES: FadR/GntR family transcriptional regulator [Sphingomonas]
MNDASSAPKSLAQVAMDAVNAYIRDEQLRVGDTLPGEGYFAERLGVSRAVMREAFGALAALKLIDVGNGRKPRVGALDGSVIAASLDHAISTAQIRVIDVWDVRRTIEMRTAALAAQHASETQIKRIVALADMLALAGPDDPATTETDIDFHLAIAEASGNRLFQQIVVSFLPLMRVAVPQAWRTRQTTADRTETIARHQRLAEAIAAGDPAEAERWMATHFDETIGALLRSKGS